MSDNKYKVIGAIAERIAEKYPDLFGNSPSSKYDAMLYALHVLDRALGDGDDDDEFIQTVKRYINQLRSRTEITNIMEWADSTTTLALRCKNGHDLLILQPANGGNIGHLIGELKRFKLQCPVCGSKDIYMEVIE